jgi:hypothetical protein
VTANAAVAVFPFASAAEHVTFVRPRLNRLPERGVQVTGTTTAGLAASFAVTVKRTRTRLAFPARTVLSWTPCSVGGVRSKSSPGTVSVPTQVSIASPAPPDSSVRFSVTWRLPDAPA